MTRERLSRGDLLLLIAVLSAFGAAVSAYLAWQWYASANAAWCDISSYFSCSRVRESPYASVAGAPTAWMGVGGFAALLLLAALALSEREVLGPWTVERWILRLSLLGAAIGVLLTILEVFVIQAICILCVLGFALDLAVLGATWRLMQPDI